MCYLDFILEDDMTAESVNNKNEIETENKTITLVVYALQTAAFLYGITAIIGVVINYVKREEVAGTLYESHFRWQIRTFWWSLIGFVIGAMTWYIFIGIIIFVITYVWVIYRVVKGFLNLNSKKQMYV